ncbi:methyl accepting chemotaxis protein [Crocosphaera subtropica ATCC 51142]|uniref:Methyl accepting chemotaxis protein n=1 Tax=Crocosphaera subtropica (strain ATCC 51142 / BH68) TaxID=43989 RepID=B1WNF3_CROS5|nr:methyl-accepting chemotaxis protein [Crocosphaera subtropica]ACB49795.1 methyl accepting chemotaxis protein [Crocosphaera subtropica ATCC 51142]
MASGTDYAKLYNEAYVAYGQGNFEEAAALMEPMAEAFPEDPDVLLLRGHIYFSLGRYETACQQYQSVIGHTDRPDLVDCAKQGLAQAQQLLAQSGDNHRSNELAEPSEIASESVDRKEQWSEPTDSSGDWESEDFELDGLDWDSAIFDDDDLGEPTIGHQVSQGQPFDNNHHPPEQRPANFEMEVDPFTTLSEVKPFDSQTDIPKTNTSDKENWTDFVDHEFSDFSFGDEQGLETEAHTGGEIAGDEDNTFVVSSSLNPPSLDNRGSTTSPEEPSSDWSNYPAQDDPTIQATPRMMPSNPAQEQNQVLDKFDAFQEEALEDLSNFDFTEMSDQLPDSDLFSQASEDLSGSLGLQTGDLLSEQGSQTVNWVKSDDMAHSSLSNSETKVIKPTVEAKQGYLGWFHNAPLNLKPWMAAGSTGIVSFVAILLVSGFAWLISPQAESTKVVDKKSTADKVETSENNTNPLQATGQASQQSPSTPNNKKQAKSGDPILLLALTGGLVGFGGTLFFGLIASYHLKRTIADLQTQFGSMYGGDYNVKATIYSEDELGQLSYNFNQLSRVILTTTSEAQQRAAEMEQAREELQRQVIRLLDDVEGAARGDLTVEAEVTADVLGAVADAFNLTIHNLREIVAQVKRTAKQVNKSSTDSELFARNNSRDALRMAEELAVTLNSVQVMTESIQRVAENAREAEEVAHTSSVTALKGGEAVERTVAGILQIRETVSETTRKVKRLAEASQEISKIVALISQIASRTNLLALNASIQAARAGEAGRGFAIVADEVRQLADRSAKSLKEIEQIVLQIQSETGSVMTAMEEGIQQVIDVTDKSEQAKRSLEDIIDVSNHINTLVRSITGDTIQQQENSKAVSQVMQSVELTAQETSQESQRVAGSLQNLVGISRDLLASVERFHIEEAQKS